MQIYLGSILLEPNRWKGEKEPSYRVSEWLERIQNAGFDGVELWENHFLKADASEREELISSRMVTLFNSYAPLDDEAQAARETAAQNALLCGATAMKFNTGNDESQSEIYLANARHWADSARGVKLLCECHPGTLLETPQAAKRAFDEWDNRFGAMIHPFSTELKVLEEWLALLGPKIQHAHVQIRHENGRPARLNHYPQQAKDALKILRDGGFTGSFTLEFTEGTSTENDTPETLWQNALDDLRFLRENWK
jgi:sugar phosphate isomerase/epimerase